MIIKSLSRVVGTQWRAVNAGGWRSVPRIHLSKSLDDAPTLSFPPAAWCPPSPSSPSLAVPGTRRHRPGSGPPHLPGAGAQLLEAGEGVDGASSFPLLPAHAQLLQAPELLHLGLQLLHLGLQALYGFRQPGGGWGNRTGGTLRGRGQPHSLQSWRDVGLGTDGQP